VPYGWGLVELVSPLKFGAVFVMIFAFVHLGFFIVSATVTPILITHCILLWYLCYICLCIYSFFTAIRM
jgi:hypothetical protein